MTACASNEPAEKIVVRTVYVCPELYFPDFPAPADGIILPLDADYKRVKTEYDENGEPIEIVYDIIPEWWLKLLLEYKLQNDETKAKYEAYKAKLN